LLLHRSYLSVSRMSAIDFVPSDWLLIEYVSFNSQCKQSEESSQCQKQFLRNPF
jgi:hypothetical protein